MIYNVNLTETAMKDLEEIVSYISDNDSIDRATDLYRRLKSACFKLEKFPHRGHIPTEIKFSGSQNFLEIIYDLYRIIYEIREDAVFVHSVLDGRRNIQEILNERILR